MDLNKLFSMQEVLDKRIESEHNLENQCLINKKVLALFVEVGELANETRCFKFWSKKTASPKEVILEEYVDCLHFILSIGITSNFKDILLSAPESSHDDATDSFLKLSCLISNFLGNKTRENYIDLFNNFLNLGSMLGFNEEDIEKAYVSKNEINHERQNQGY